MDWVRKVTPHLPPPPPTLCMLKPHMVLLAEAREPAGVEAGKNYLRGTGRL